MIARVVDPPVGESLRDGVYCGRAWLCDPRDTTIAIVDRAWAILRRHVGDDPRSAHARLGDPEHFARVGAARRAVFEDPVLRRLFVELGSALGIEPRALRFEPPKLRAVVPAGHENEAAWPVYVAHRDTWYAVPRAVVNVWIALHDVSEEETFELFFDRFDVPVPNDSATFDYAAWQAPGRGLRIGWQDSNASSTASYPTVVGEPDLGAGARFACARAGWLVFSGAHLHKTRAHAQSLTRFSLDARLVHAGDAASGRGAPCVDVACRGDASFDYLEGERFVG